MRDNEKEYASCNVQPLVVLAQHPFQLKRPKDLPGWNRWPKEIPAQALFDPLATVSATYGVAFQTQFRGNQCQWSSRPTTFVIDRDGVLRYAGGIPQDDMREKAIFPILDKLKLEK